MGISAASSCLLTWCCPHLMLAFGLIFGVAHTPLLDCDTSGSTRLVALLDVAGVRMVGVVLPYPFDHLSTETAMPEVDACSYGAHTSEARLRKVFIYYEEVGYLAHGIRCGCEFASVPSFAVAPIPTTETVTGTTVVGFIWHHQLLVFRTASLLISVDEFGYLWGHLPAVCPYPLPPIELSPANLNPLTLLNINLDAA